MAYSLSSGSEIKTRSRRELGFIGTADYHPPESYPSFDLLKKVSPDVRTKILKVIPEADYVFTLLSTVEPGRKVDNGGKIVETKITPDQVKGLGDLIFKAYCGYCDVPQDSWRKNILIQPIVRQTLKSVTEDHVPATAFKRALRIDADKPVYNEIGNEGITGPGGFHQDFEDISDREGSNGKIMHDAVCRFVLNFLQNQVKYDPENREAAQKLIADIEKEGWNKALKLEDYNKIEGPTKTIKDDSFDFSNNRLVKNRSGDFVLRPLDLTRNGLNAIIFRCFSKDGNEFVDLPASLLIAKNDAQIEQLLLKGDDKIIWQKVEKIENEDPVMTPICNLYITDSFPNSDSKVFKYRGNRGRSMDIGIIDLTENGGRVFVLGGSHLMIDGMGQSKNFAAHLHDMPVNPNLLKKVKYPSYFIYPPLPRVGEVNENIRKLGLSDLVIVQDFDKEGILTKELKRFNELVVLPKTDKLKKLLVAENFSEEEAEKISRMFTPFLSRSTLLQSVAEASVGRMMNIAALKEQTYHRMSTAVTKSLPQKVLEGIRKNINGQPVNLNLLSEYPTKDNSIVGVLGALDHSRMEVVAASYGISVLGGIQSLLNFYQDNIRQPTDLIYTQLLDLSRQTGFISDKTIKEQGDIFVTAQNHQEQTMGLFIGLLGKTITARINIEYPQYLNKLDLGIKIEDDVLREVLGNNNNDETRMYIKAFGSMCRGFSRGGRIDNVGVIDELMSADLLSIDGDKKLEVIRLFVIANFYQNIRNIVKTSTKFLAELNNAIELNKDKLTKDGYIFENK